MQRKSEADLLWYYAYTVHRKGNNNRSFADFLLSLRTGQHIRHKSKREDVVEDTKIMEVRHMPGVVVLLVAYVSNQLMPASTVADEDDAVTHGQVAEGHRIFLSTHIGFALTPSADGGHKVLLERTEGVHRTRIRALLNHLMFEQRSGDPVSWLHVDLKPVTSSAIRDKLANADTQTVLKMRARASGIDDLGEVEFEVMHVARAPSRKIMSFINRTPRIQDYSSVYISSELDDGSTIQADWLPSEQELLEAAWIERTRIRVEPEIVNMRESIHDGIAEHIRERIR